MEIQPFTPQDRLARLAALVNAVVVILVPITAVLSLTALTPDFSNTGTTVRPPNAPVIVPLIQLAIFLSAVSTPFAMVVAWRTWVHAVRWETLGERGWRGCSKAVWSDSPWRCGCCCQASSPGRWTRHRT